MTRPTLKAAAERVLVASGLPSLGRQWRRSRVLILAYHNVVPDRAAGAGDASLHLPLSKFTAQIDRLTRTHDVVGLSEAWHTPRNGGRPKAVVTFDDGYRGAVLLGLPELAKRGLPATMFVVPGFVGKTGFWWDRFAEGAGGWDAALRESLLTEHQGRDLSIEAWAESREIEPVEQSEWFRVASQAELEAAARSDAIRFGCHTWSHPNLAALDAVQVTQECAAARAWLEERFDRVAGWLSYPYGRYSEMVERIVRDLGFEGALAVTGGWWNGRPEARFRLPRWNVPAGISLEGFELRAAGFWCR